MNTTKPVVTVMNVSGMEGYLMLLADLSRPETLDMKDAFLRGWFSFKTEQDVMTDEEIHSAMREAGYHRCPDGIYRRTPSNGMFDGLCGHCEAAEYYDDDASAASVEANRSAAPALTITELHALKDRYGHAVMLAAFDMEVPAVDLPAIVFDNDGWSQELPAKDGSWFHIYRLRSGAKYVLKGKDARDISPVLSFAGVLALAATRVNGSEPEPSPLTLDTITDDDRRTNYGAF